MSPDYRLFAGLEVLGLTYVTYVLGFQQLNQEQNQAWKALKRRRGRLPFPLRGFQFYWITKGILICLNEQVEYSLSDYLNTHELTNIII